MSVVMQPKKKTMWFRLFLPSLFVSAITFWLQHTGLLQGFEMMALETFQLVGKPKARSIGSEVRIVSITEQYHIQHFGGSYPLAPSGVKNLLKAIAKGKPKLIGVDLDTSHWSRSDLSDLPSDVPIVWAADAIVDENHRLCLRDVLGNAKGPDDIDIGIAVFPKDMDGVTRRYRRFLTAYQHCDKATADEGMVRSFPWAVVAHLLAKNKEVAQKSEPDLVLNFFGDNYNLRMISAEDVIAASSGEDWPTHGALKDQVVLLGGSFHAAHDEHVTPVGVLNGVQLTAQAVDSELNRGGLHQTDELLMYLLEFLIGVTLVGINRISWVQRAPLLIGGAVFILLACISSYLVFSSLALWPNFIPITFAVLVHEIYHQSRQNQELKKLLIGMPQSCRLDPTARERL